MKTSYYIAGTGILLVLIVGALVYMFVNLGTEPEPQTNVNTVDPFSTGPIVNFTQPRPGQTTTGTTTVETTEVTLGDLKPALVRNFLKDADSIPMIDEQTGEVYFSIGSLPEYGSTTASEARLASIPFSEERKYEMLYFPSTGSFIIFIFSEPIAELRRTMTTDLATRLGVSDQEVCYVLATVRVTASANQFYSGRNIGFSGCKNADKLPGD